MTEECSNVSNLLRNKTGFSTFAGSDGDDDRGTSWKLTKLVAKLVYNAEKYCIF